LAVHRARRPLTKSATPPVVEVAAAVGAVLKAEIGNAPMPVLSTSSPSAKGATRRWNSVAELVREVADARVWGGMHYRFSSEVGIAMGTRIGELAAAKHLSQPH